MSLTYLCPPSPDVLHGAHSITFLLPFALLLRRLREDLLLAPLRRRSGRGGHLGLCHATGTQRHGATLRGTEGFVRQKWEGLHHRKGGIYQFKELLGM